MPLFSGTHDIQNLTVFQKIHNQSNCSDIDITWSYLNGSMPTGLFAIVSSLTNRSDVHYVVIDGKRQTNTCITIDNLSQDQYSVFVYDREEDLLPELSPAGSSLMVSVINSCQNITQSGAVNFSL